jgi:large subunit ribosomal protein L10
MAITRLKKEEILKSLVESFGSAKSIVFARNNGLSVKDTKELRSTLRGENITFQVAKKTLFKKAAEANNMTGFELDLLEGAVGVAISSEDEVIPAKMIATFAKKNENVELVAGIVDGKFLGESEIKELSNLPSKEELYAKLLGSMQAPLSGFVGIGNNLISGLVRTLDQVREQKEAA